MRSPAEIRDDGRRFCETAFALMALAALAFALAVDAGLLPLALEASARSIIAWSFVGLAAADAALLVIWRHLLDWIAGA